jgi:hypothetical protein
MKTIYSIFLALLILPHVRGTEPVSIEKFEKITDASERAKLIDQAPPEQKEKLKSIDSLHQGLLLRWGGEAGLKTAKESLAVKARGLGSLEDLFKMQTGIWGSYIGGALATNEKEGGTNNQQNAELKKATEEEDAIEKRLPIVHTLVFNMAASPQALELNKRAEQFRQKLSKRLMTDGSAPCLPITNEERVEVNRRMDQFFTEMQNLPKLTPEQAQKECDAISDEKVPPW